MERLQLPEALENLLSGMTFEENKIGCSEAGVYRLRSTSGTCYLKVEPESGELQTEYENISWLRGRLPVPDIMGWYGDGVRNYLLLSEIPGTMSCDGYYLEHPSAAVSVLAKGIKLLHSIEIQSCPIDNRLDIKLRKAAENIRSNKVDMDDWEESSRRFSSPQALMDHLCANRPAREEWVFSHGDYCLPNIFGRGEEVTGFIDLGRAGGADLWQDVALCIRSLRRNFGTGEYGALLLEQIGMPMNREKLDYYILLDELL